MEVDPRCSLIRVDSSNYFMSEGTRLRGGLLNGGRSVALDVGCAGGFLRSIGLTNFIGVDVRAAGVVTVRASAENLPFRD